ncbi:MAG TPA: DUF167 domain-containing protein, partial [Thermoleophilia bacterium]|nr:DUF167 domain-containing protein [Thermoleophilia bacterium]
MRGRRSGARPTTCWPTSRTRSTATSSSGETGPLRGSATGISLALWVTPGAARSAIVGVAEGRLRVRLGAPAAEGRANRELRRFLASVLDVAPSAVELTQGESSRRKVVHIAGLERDAVARVLGL